MNIFKQLLKKILLLLGFKIVRLDKGLFSWYNKTDIFSDNDFSWIKRIGIRSVIDVGANTGQFSLWISKLLPEARIYAFEPIGECFRELTHNMARHKNFKSYNFALGEEKCNRLFFRSESLQNASFLQKSEFYHNLVPFDLNSNSNELIIIDTLDNIFNEIVLEDNVLLKIDVQGYEDKVLNGGKKILSRVPIIIIETAFCELYKDQPLFDRVYRMLLDMDFLYFGSLKEHRSFSCNLPFQQDSVFIKKNSPFVYSMLKKGG
ncbi:MAG: FkbM family methyltransferase [Candidatus Omnitrophica bacterium]|nr:FkbM family methyltransferase [Candidatus Omnitrophota bacterium]